MQAAACADRTQRDHYVSSAGWEIGCDSSSYAYGLTVGCVTSILVVALLPDKERPTMVFRDLHWQVCSAATVQQCLGWFRCEWEAGKGVGRLVRVVLGLDVVEGGRCEDWIKI